MSGSDMSMIDSDLSGQPNDSPPAGPQPQPPLDDGSTPDRPPPAPNPFQVLMDSVQAMANNQILLQNLFNQIGAQAQAAQVGSTVGSNPTRPSGTIRVKEPRVFDGRAIELIPFLDELHSSMHLQLPGDISIFGHD